MKFTPEQVETLRDTTQRMYYTLEALKSAVKHAGTTENDSVIRVDISRAISHMEKRSKTIVDILNSHLL